MEPFTPPARHHAPLWPLGAAVGLALWLAALGLGATPWAVWLNALGWPINAHGHLYLYAHGHPFVDARTWHGLPNALDVLSNLPLVLAGAWGLWRLRAHQVAAAPRDALTVFFAGLVLSGVGSAVYHWAPGLPTLIGDRLGMAVAFAGALGLTLHERGWPGVQVALWALLLMGAVSAVLPWINANVLPWAVLQFGGMAVVVLLAWRRPAPGALGVSLAALVAWYALAKVLELNDATVFAATGESVSGHSLKHMAAALAAWPVWRALARQPLRHNGPRCAA